MTESLVRYGYVPLMLIGINGAAIGLARAPWAELWMAALIVAAIGLSFVAERILPSSCCGTGSGQVIHNDVRVPDEIQKDLRAPEGRVHPVDTMWFSVSARPRRRGRQGGQDLPEPPRYLDFAPTNGESAD